MSAIEHDAIGGRRKLSEAIEEDMLALLQRGDLKPGDVLPSERELMATYKIGRPAVREAMQNLQRMGLVQIRHGERPRVAAPAVEKVFSQLTESMHHILSHSAGSLGFLLEVREILEMEMARMAAFECNPEHIQRLRDILDAQEAAMDKPDEFMRLDGEFHFEIARSSGNPICIALCEAIFGWLKTFHVQWVRRLGLGDLTMSEHRAVLRAIAEGDPQAAALSMKTHLNRANSQYATGNATRR